MRSDCWSGRRGDVLPVASVRYLVAIASLAAEQVSALCSARQLDKTNLVEDVLNGVRLDVTVEQSDEFFKKTCEFIDCQIAL